MRLILPTTKYKTSFLKYMKELLEIGKIDQRYFGDIYKDFGAFVKKQREQKTHPKRGDVPVIQYWILEKNQIIGQGVLHKKLNAHLKKFGGHIGYSIRPSERGKGYGTKALALLLKKAKLLGLSKVLLVVREKNIPSIKIIESSGGVFKKQTADQKNVYKHYEIKLS